MSDQWMRGPSPDLSAAQKQPAEAGRWGIVSRLTVSFAAVIVMAVTANLIAEHGVTLIETTDLISQPMRAVSTPSAAKGLQTESDTAGASIVATDISGVLAALERTHLAFQARLQVDDPELWAELLRASAALAEQGERVPQSMSEQGDPVAPSTPALLSAYLKQVDTTVKLADSRRASISNYRSALKDLEALIAREIDKGWKVMGRIVARQSLVALGRDLQAIEASAGVLNAASYRDAAGLAALSKSEEEFGARLKKSSESLRRSQGVDWEKQVSAAFEKLASSHRNAVVADQKLRTSTPRVAELRDGAAAAIARSAGQIPGADTSRNGPAPTAPDSLEATAPSIGDRQVERRVSQVVAPTERRYRTVVAMITLAVLICILAITISTIESIVRPVRKLIHAARQLGEGKEAQVSRGGIRELDELAVEFSRMAGQLSTARAALIAHQQHLEERVEERTVALKHLAEHDVLTELPNRRLLLERLDVALASAAATGQYVGVYFLDLDNFKNINDGMGHEFGDSVLLSVSQRLAEQTASFGFAGRIGGDEFVIVYPEAGSYAKLAEMGEHILRAFQRPVGVGERKLTLSTSLGISIFPDHGRDSAVLLRAADAALFRAKALGRNQLHVFSPELVELAHTKFVVEQGLRRALDLGEFEMVYQPEVDLETLETVMVEALLRWRTPEGALLAPDAFLSVAEESGLIADVSDWVLRTVIATAAGWHRGAWPQVRVAINVSPRQLVDIKFAGRVQALLREHQLPPECIELELTENLLQTGAATIEALRQLRAHGIAIALDDFGTGYSSFSSLEVLPLTRVKLDRSLIASVDANSPAAAIASSIISLCRSLGFQITAEGVERPEQLAMLIRQGATHVQGYLLSRPVARDDVVTTRGSVKARLVELLLTTPPAASPVEHASAGQEHPAEGKVQPYKR
jgi:diguanylate cyclase (GGDEF)-like protein